MSKKEYILTLLDALEGIRPLARGLHVVIKNQEVDEQLLDGLVEVFKSGISQVSGDIAQSKMNQGSQMLEKIRLLEKQEDASHEQELHQMLQKLR